MPVTYYGPKTVTKQLFREQLIDNPPPVIAIDTETISNNEKIPILFAVATAPNEAWTFDVFPEAAEEISLLKSLMNNKSINKVYANVMFDLKVEELIFQDYPYDYSNITDILTWARILGHIRAGVNDIAAYIGKSTENAGEMMKAAGVKTMLGLPREQVAAKCAHDAMVTLDIYHYLKPQIEAVEGLSPDYIQVERDVIPVLVDLSQHGLRVDQDYRSFLEKKMEEERDYYYNICMDDYDFNPGSGKQAGYVLAVERGVRLPPTKSKKQYKTDEDTLQFVDDPLATVILGFKHANSILTKYLYPLRGVDYAYTNYGIDTEVGRTKSSGDKEEGRFNLQNIPSDSTKVGVDVRGCFLPDNGMFTSGDYSQMHLRFLMHMSGDREMERVYYDGMDGGDIHNATSRKIGRKRAIAKTINFAIPYGATAQAVSVNAKIKDRKFCQQLIDEWLSAYPDAAAWLHEAAKYAEHHNKSLPTLFGRQIAIPDEWTRWGKLDVEAKHRKGQNYPVLGSDGEVIKRGLIVCAKHELPLAATVHDSITCDGDIEFPIFELENIAPFRIPFEVEKTERWK